MQNIRKAAVLGSGVMGAAIAGHLANAGVDCYLLDRVPTDVTEEEKRQGKSFADPEVRNRLSRLGRERLLQDNPAPLFTKKAAERIQIGNFTDDFQALAHVDWIIEAVVEKLSIKQQLLTQIDDIWQPGTIVSSNTSGLSIAAIAEGCSPQLQRHFMGTHFFNPPRYMKLLEVIPTTHTDPALIDQMCAFAERRLGKGVVMAKDTPNFIANRIGVYGLLITFQEMVAQGLTPEQVDQITGPALGRPKSATFRTLDLVGLDTFAQVADNVHDHVEEQWEKRTFAVPNTIRKLIQMGRLGEKSGCGFYRKIKGKNGSQILSLNLETMDYKPRGKLTAGSLAAAKRAKTTPERLRALLYADDQAGKFAWNVTKKTLLYSAIKLTEIAADVPAIDRALRWGFNWALGPFEMWDALGVKRSVQRMREEGETIPAWVETMLAQGRDSFYAHTQERMTVFGPENNEIPVEEDPRKISLMRLKKSGRVIRGNRGASLIDLGDDVACLAFHSPKNAIAPDIVAMMHTAVKEVAANYRGLVIGNQGRHFSVGANLMMILMEAQNENWSEIEWIVKGFQDATMAIKACPRPVVAAPFKRTLGGGVEVCLPADRIQAAAETYMGLVEVGVGVIPSGGGIKEMLIRFSESSDPQHVLGTLQERVNDLFERIGMARVSTSAAHAKQLGYLREQDGITMNEDDVIYDAKRVVLQLSNTGGDCPKSPAMIPVVGETGYNVLKLGAYTMLQSGAISEHDYKIADKLAYVLAGGQVPAGTQVTEQHLLDLEREAFLSLCGEPKSQARMQHMLSKNKPLRN